MKLKKIPRIPMIIMIAAIILSGSYCLAKEIKDFGLRVENNVNKVWTVKFNQDLDETSINNDNIYIVDEEENSKVDVKITKGKDSKTLVIQPPTAGYKHGHTYRLEVKEGIKSLKNHNLIRSAKLKFKIPKSDVKIKSEIQRHGVQGIWCRTQTSHIKIDVFNNNGIIQKNQDITIAGRKVKITKGDNSFDIKWKIIKAFADDQTWNAENIFLGVQGNKPTTVTFIAKKPAANVNVLGTDNSEIKFIQRDDVEGFKGVSEVREICNVTVLKASGKNENLKINVKATKNAPLNEIVNVEINKTYDTKDIAEAIYNSIKNNDLLTRIYVIKLNKENSKIILTQRMGDDIDTEVSILN